jgi:hypothetical protein
MTAFPAGISIRPLLAGNETQDGILRPEFININQCEIEGHRPK